MAGELTPHGQRLHLPELRQHLLRALSDPAAGHRELHQLRLRRIENRVGVAAVRDMALRAGIPETGTGWATTDNLTFVLGTASPHTLDVANAYATFAARGVRATPTTLRRVGTADGRTLYTPTTTPERTIDENTADLVNHALQSVVNNGTGRPAQALGRPVAGKTGSTDEYLSAWFAGYTPQLATAVTFSKDDKAGNPFSLSGTGGMPQFYGSGYPARVWTAYMIGALDGTPVQQFTTPTAFPTGAGLLPPPPPAPIPPDPVATPGHPHRDPADHRRATSSTAGSKPHTKTEEARQTRRHVEREGPRAVAHRQAGPGMRDRRGNLPSYWATNWATTVAPLPGSPTPSPFPPPPEGWTPYRARRPEDARCGGCRCRVAEVYQGQPGGDSRSSCGRTRARRASCGCRTGHLGGQ